MRSFHSTVLAMLLILVAGSEWTLLAEAGDVTFTGTVQYEGPYTGDTLYVAALDTTTADSVVLLGLKAYHEGSPPFDQAYSLTFDNTGAPVEVIVFGYIPQRLGSIAHNGRSF